MRCKRPITNGWMETSPGRRRTTRPPSTVGYANTTPAIAGRRNDNADVFAPIYAVVNSERLPSFNALDIRIDKTWVFDLWSLDLFLDIQNVYNRRSVEGVTYNYNYTQRQYFTGLPILPIIGVKGSF